MQRSRKTNQGRLKNTGHVDVTEYDYIKHLLSKSKASQADVARMVRRSESLISYIAHSKDYADYCEQREKTAGNPKEVKQVLKTTPGKTITANSNQVELIPGTDIPAMGDVRDIPTPAQMSASARSATPISKFNKDGSPKIKTDYSGALLGQTARLTSAISELNVTMLTLRPIFAKFVDESNGFERPVEDSGPKWYHIALMILGMFVVVVGYLFLITVK